MRLGIAFLALLTAASLSAAQTAEELNLPETFSVIWKAPKPPVIDGDLNDWRFAAAIFVSDKSVQPLEDCSGVLMMMWDEDNLYFAAKVYDDELVQGMSGANIWKEDDVQFDLDIDREGDRNITVYNDDDFQIGFSPGDFEGEAPEIWGWNPGGGVPMNRPEDAEIKSAKFEGGWVIEARIGREEFNADLIGLKRFEEGMVLGFGRCINDYDRKSGDGGVSSGGAWKDTSKMYDIELGGPFPVSPLSDLITAWGYIKSM